MTSRPTAEGKPVERADLALVVLLLAILTAEILGWRANHRSASELWQTYRSAQPKTKIEALHILANRDRPRGFDQAFVDEILASQHSLIREFAMTYDVTRLSGKSRQRAYLTTLLPDSDEEVRCRFFLRHQNSRFSRAELRSYFESLRPASPTRAAKPDNESLGAVQ